MRPPPVFFSALQRTAVRRVVPTAGLQARMRCPPAPALRGVRAAHDGVWYKAESGSEANKPSDSASASKTTDSTDAKSGPRSVPSSDTKTLLIVYHSLTDGARQMATAAYEAAVGAEAEGVHVRLVPARSAGPEDILAAEGYIFATPENLAAMAGAMKDFFDRAYYPVLGRANGRPYAALICAGSDGEGALRQLDRIALGWRLKKAAEGTIVCTHAQSPERVYAMKKIGEEDLERCREVGAAMAEGLALGVF